MIVYLVVSVLFFLTVVYFIVCSRLLFTSRRSEEKFLNRRITGTLEGIAAVGIVLMHIATHSTGMELTGLIGIYVKFCKSLGGVGVNIFFFLSGYGNYLSLTEKSSNRDRLSWFVRRIVNILIIYLTCYFISLSMLMLEGFIPTVKETVSNILFLQMPLTNAWYVRVQLSMYLWLYMAFMLSQKQNLRIILLVLCCIAEALILYILGFSEHWWMSVLCFPVGTATAVYRKIIEKQLDRYRSQMIVLCVILFPISYYMGASNDLFLVKIVGNAILASVIIAFSEIVSLGSGLYRIIGTSSLQLYLIHIGFISWIFQERILTNKGVLLAILLTAIGTLLAKIIGDRIRGLILKPVS